MTGCCARDYEKVFGRNTADRDARRFREHGLRGSAKALAELAGDVRGESVLEVGGGVGAIEIELLEAGAAQVTNVELAATYEDAAGTLLAERGLAGRVDRRVGDFVSEADAIEPHDVVVMHRVVCCYPDVDELIGAAAQHARKRMVLTYPQERGVLRTAFSLVNAVMRVSGSTFQVYLHPVDRIAAAAAAQGLTLAERRRHRFVWESAAFSAVP
ncbi:MAG TPA: methyltransferase domain-containing protein [Gaiellaceae bacterium]